MQRVYYISMEFLVGRSLMNAMVNLGIESEIEEALYEVLLISSNKIFMMVFIFIVMIMHA